MFLPFLTAVHLPGVHVGHSDVRRQREAEDSLQDVRRGQLSGGGHPRDGEGHEGCHLTEIPTLIIASQNCDDPSNLSVTKSLQSLFQSIYSMLDGAGVDSLGDPAEKARECFKYIGMFTVLYYQFSQANGSQWRWETVRR